jgi:hypothetical protein
LLVSFPVPVYWILVEILKIAVPKKGSFDSDPVSLIIHHIEAEVEHNFFPLLVVRIPCSCVFLTFSNRFAEIAPPSSHYDMKLVMCGKAPQKLIQLAKTKRPKSLAVVANETLARSIFSYAASEESGAGKISIYLDTSDA